MTIKIYNFEEVKSISALEYFGESYPVDMFNAKYAHKKEDGTKETPAEVFNRVAFGLASMESNFKRAEELQKIWFSLMWEGWFRPGGSILAGVGASEKISLNNCTTVALEKDSLESIAQTRYWLKKVAAYRQGVGFDASVLRPRGARVRNAAVKSSGSIPWIDDLVNIGKKVGQEGRMPALLVSLKVSHPDIEEFICCKDELDQINNANISVQITNEFMLAVENDQDWELSFHVEATDEHISRIVKAKALFRLIAEHAHKAAEPGVQYIDLMRDGSMVQAVCLATKDNRFKIISTNACSEKPLPADSVCNLLSINADKFSPNPEEYQKQLEEIIPYAAELSDCVIDYELNHELSPLPRQKEMVTLLREIGMGITNVHGWLVKEDIAYDSDKAITKVHDFMKHYAITVFKTSMELGKRKGNAPAFDLVTNKTDLMASIYFKNIVDELYAGDASKVKYMRNMAHMSIAPAGSISDSFPERCFSSGIEPIINSYYWRKTRAINKGVYTHYFTIPARVKDYVLDKISLCLKDCADGDEDPILKDLELLENFSGSELDDDGKLGLELVPIINKYLPEGFFKPAHKIDPIQKIRLMAQAYKWIDAAVSCTYNLDEDATVDVVEDIYLEAYRQGVRAVSVYVEGSREGIFIFEDPITNKAKFENSGKTSLCADNRPVVITPVCAPKRPASLPCNIHHCSVKGVPWLVIVGMLEDNLYEIFCGEAEEIYVPKSCKSGNIIKRRGGKYSLEISIRNSLVEYKDLAHVLMTTEQRAVTRLLSLAMRHGTPLEFIQSQLKKVNGDITDFSAVVARVLGSYIKQYVFIKENDKCPACGENSMVRTEGCMKCSSAGCGYSRCD